MFLLLGNTSTDCQCLSAGIHAGHATTDSCTARVPPPFLSPTLDNRMTRSSTQNSAASQKTDFDSLDIQSLSLASLQDNLHMHVKLVRALPELLAQCGNKKLSQEQRDAAQRCVSLLAATVSPNTLRQMLPLLLDACSPQNRWQQRMAALDAIAAFGDHAPDQLGVSLPDVIPIVAECVVDLHSQVTEAAERALVAVCEVVGNRDIEHLTQKILRCITHPEDTEEIMHALAGVTFVQAVESPALAMVVPLLLRGLVSSKSATVRQAALIIDNMSRLVDDPIDAAPFMPFLMPALERAADIQSNPEARSVAERALEQLRALNFQVQDALERQQHIDHTRVATLLAAKMNIKGSLLIDHIAHMACSLMSIHKFDKNSWKEIQNALGLINKDRAAACIDSVRTELQAMAKPLPPKDEIDDPALELCSCTFTLAYGTKTLLHNANLRLLRGAKYGLLGGNDSGKTTLMRAISNGSVNGFPDPAEVRTVFVEADILGELSHLSCVDYVMSDPNLQGMDRDQVLQVMNSVGFTDTGKARPTNPVSSLSGGWRMKLAMARAMLQKADILLLDEPTNHLDVINVAWVKNYINSLTDVTCIMVSHDSGFLRDCCTHILQIRNLKLKMFRGNLDAFIESNPEAKSYFNIKSTKLRFTYNLLK